MSEPAGVYTCTGCHAGWERLEILCPACGLAWRPSASTDVFRYFGFADPSEVWRHPERLGEAYRRVQRWIHPDRWAGSSPELALLAAEHAVFASDAYRHLKEPRGAVAYYLAGLGYDPRVYRGTSAEDLASILSLAEDFSTGALSLERLRDRAQEAEARCLASVSAGDFAAARDHWIAWQMLARIGEHRLTEGS